MKISLNKYKNIYVRTLCSICKNESPCDIHHINKNRKDNSLQNLIVVCKSCHKRIHEIEKALDIHPITALELFVEHRMYAYSSKHFAEEKFYANHPRFDF